MYVGAYGIQLDGPVEPAAQVVLEDFGVEVAALFPRGA